MYRLRSISRELALQGKEYMYFITQCYKTFMNLLCQKLKGKLRQVADKILNLFERMCCSLDRVI